MKHLLFLLAPVIFLAQRSDIIAQSCSPDVTPPTALGCNAQFDINSSLNCPFPMPDFTPSGAFILVVSDNCTPTEDLVVTQVPAPGSPIDFGPLEIIMTVSDAAGNATVCTFNINVNDVKTPTLSCPDEITLGCNALMPDVSELVTVSDNCPSSGEIIVVQSISPGSILGPDDQQVEVYVSQHGSRSPSCFIDIVVEDQNPPIARCRPATIQLDETGVANLVAGDIDDGSSDDCGPVTLSLDKTQFACNELGLQSVTLTATDQEGQSSTCTAMVNVIGPDRDCDGVADICDVCPGGDDRVDNNLDGLPDCANFPGLGALIDDWKCGKNKDKVLICHISPGNPSKHRTLCISPDDVEDHLALGGFIGGCETATCAEIAGRKPLNNKQTYFQNLSIFPNPALDRIQLDLRMLDDEPGDKTLLILNNLGQILYREQLPFDNLSSRHPVDLSRLNSGVYYVKIQTNQKLLAIGRLSLVK